MTAPAAVCTEQVWRGSTWNGASGPCNKPVKRDGRCGVHANAHDKAAARAADERRHRLEHEVYHAHAPALSALTGLPFDYGLTRDGEWQLTLRGTDNVVALLALLQADRAGQR